jgi:hypothetical protein
VLIPPDFKLYRKTAKEEWLRGEGDFTFREVIIWRDTTSAFGYIRFDGTRSPEPSLDETCTALIDTMSVRLAAYQTFSYSHAYIADAAWPGLDGWIKLRASDARHERHAEMLAIVRSLQYRH